MKLNTILKYTLALGIPVISMVACTSSGNNPGIEYAPNMYVSQAYEPFSQEEGFVGYNPNNMTMRLPVNGTIARGQSTFVYPYGNTPEGYAASAGYTSWIAGTKANVADGERLYNINCWHCHGKKGGNDGPIFKSKKMPAPSWPNYQDDYIKNLPEGTAYHTITYGKGLMGSHAFLLSPDERWKVIKYVKSLAYGDAYQYAADATPTQGNNGANTANSNGETPEMPQTSSVSFPGTPAEKAMIMSAMSKVDFKGFPNRKEMKGNAASNLDIVAKYLKSHPDYKATIVGHTGVTLTEEGAATLGIDRANNVIKYLASQGVNTANLNAKSIADAGMDGDVTSSQDRQANRRVEIEIYK